MEPALFVQKCSWVGWVMMIPTAGNPHHGGVGWVMKSTSWWVWLIECVGVAHDGVV